MSWTVHLQGGPRRVNHAAAVMGDLIYSFGGYNLNEDFSQRKPLDVHVFNTGNLRWDRVPVTFTILCDDDIANIPFQRFGHTVVAYGQKIIVWGGRDDDSACNQVFFFDTEDWSWLFPRVTGMVPNAREGHTACLIEHRMYIFGGFEVESQRFSRDVFYLDLLTMKWQYVITSGEVAKFRDFHSATAIGSRMYVFGGRGDFDGPNGLHNEEYCSDIIYLDTETNKWHKPKSTGDIPPGRRSHSAFELKGYLYIFGGYNGLTEEHFNDLHRYDFEKHEWKLVHTHGKPPIRRRRQSCAVIGSKVYLFGGTSPWTEVHKQNLGDRNLLNNTNHNHHQLVPNQHQHPNIIGGEHLDEDDEGDYEEDIEQINVNNEILHHWVLVDATQDELEATLMDLNDLHILDFSPSLHTICLLKVVEHKLDLSELPHIIRREFLSWTTPNTLSR